MALTPSNMLALGTKAPDFSLPDTNSNKTFHLNDFQSNSATVLMFICNHCPYVIHVMPEIVRIFNDYDKLGVKFIAISSNDIDSHPEDSPENMKKFAEAWKMNFPYLYDETQSIAKKYDASCTPDFYIFDKNFSLSYRGRIDNSRPNSAIPLSGKDIRTALDLLIDEKPVSNIQYPSMGCNIKWKN